MNAIENCSALVSSGRRYPRAEQQAGGDRPHRQTLSLSASPCLRG